MAIPRIPTGEFSGRNWSTTNEAGKGSKPRNNGSDAFRDNFDLIKGFGKIPKSENGHLRIKHAPDGTRIILSELPESPKPEPSPSAS